MGLNDNPTGANATGYSSLCPSILGSVGQASRIASASANVSPSKRPSQRRAKLTW